MYGTMSYIISSVWFNGVHCIIRFGTVKISAVDPQLR